ncbi:hypothetical protein [Pyrobaculum aerophilum]|uniref:Uncharacterized protein n=1 Tax=Pyrobaculum aerophilum TaxID=13773 RepID=A0A832SHG5_9CREN|nr:hypothetical protein [Pyrobaculum aerophilum]HII46698.1 hypothetical protein [Pyrobaculum aerophilum]
MPSAGDVGTLYTGVVKQSAEIIGSIPMQAAGDMTVAMCVVNGVPLTIRITTTATMSGQTLYHLGHERHESRPLQRGHLPQNPGRGQGLGPSIITSAPQISLSASPALVAASSTDTAVMFTRPIFRFGLVVLVNPPAVIVVYIVSR